MLNFSVCEQGSDLYNRVSSFASSIYEKRHSVYLESFPEIFCHASVNEKIIGCVGISLGENRDKLLLETYLPYDVLDLLSNGNSSRKHFGEIGTRAVDDDYVRDNNISSIEISSAITAELIIHAYQKNLHYLVFTTNRSIRIVAKTLNAKLFDLGKPDLTKKSPEFQEKWKNFFNVPQFCFGIDTAQAIEGSLRYKESMMLPA